MRVTRQLFHTECGFPQPLGATVCEQGINFALYAKEATAVNLCLFDRGAPLQEIPLDPQQHKTGFVWHILVKNLPSPIAYAYRVDGPTELFPFLRFDKEILLMDPYAKEADSTIAWGEAEKYHPSGRVVPPLNFDWQGVRPPKLATQDLIIYEMHVRAFTQHPSSQVAHPGTFLGIIEKIPYLLEMGINAIELMPIQEFNENDVTFHNPVTKQRLYNFWGYSTVNFFSPMNRYSTQEEVGAATREFKTLVRELHRHGIEVILDVVFNHTAEGNQRGPILSFKGIANSTYYLLDSEGKYLNFSGCGNTVSCNQPIVSDLILDALRYWVLEMHVDGFRFDLASILSRDRQGQPLDRAPILERITDDPVLADIKLIAEPWDTGGLYQVGNFYPYNTRWSEWNGRYRDAVRRFIKGSPGTKGEFVGRLCGSQDLYSGRSPTCSLNLIVCHDGLTLQDLVSYNHKHNHENGEHNRDGSNDNDSWNCGHEGPTSQAKINTLRSKQKRNFHLALMVSLGLPMLFMGDEYGHTKKGNNNTWCQDNELNWFLWNQLSSDPGFKRFYFELIHFRKRHSLLRRNYFFTDKDVVWHGVEPLKPDWSPDNQLAAFTLIDHHVHQDLYILFNAHGNHSIVEFPEPPNGLTWHWIVNTSQPSPQDYYREEEAPQVGYLLYKVPAFSALLLKALPTQK
jgi:isoamylase